MSSDVDQVDRAAHEVGAHHALAARAGASSAGGVERAQPRPEADERLLRLLRLQAAQVRDGVEDRQVGAVEQELPGEGRPVQRAGVEDGHRAPPCQELRVFTMGTWGFGPFDNDTAADWAGRLDEVARRRRGPR